MIVSRSTHLGLAQTANRHLQTAMSELSRLQDRASSRQAITRPSDDPRGTADVLALRSELARIAQGERNASNADGWLTTVDSALASSTSILQRVRDLTVQGSNTATMSASAREGLAAEFEGLRDDLLAQADASYLGRFVFAGDSTAGGATAAGYLFTGSGTAPVMRRIDQEGAGVRVDVDGRTVFGEGAQSVFALLDSLASELRAGSSIGDRIADVDGHLTAVITAHAEIGSRQTQLERASAAHADRKIDVTTQRSAVEDVDLAETILQLTVQSTVYQTALATTARVLPPTLVDFLR